jgi:hypothetical protein
MLAEPIIPCLASGPWQGASPPHTTLMNRLQQEEENNGVSLRKAAARQASTL